MWGPRPTHHRCGERSNVTVEHMSSVPAHNTEIANPPVCGKTRLTNVVFTGWTCAGFLEVLRCLHARPSGAERLAGWDRRARPRDASRDLERRPRAKYYVKEYIEMNPSRIRVLLVSLLAVFALSAIASASASATCYRVAEAKTGRFKTRETCEAGTPVIAKGEWINVSKLETKLSGDEWCAKVETIETGTYEDAGRTKAKAKGEYIKVHVPAFWLCRKGGTEKYTEHLCKESSGWRMVLPARGIG